MTHASDLNLFETYLTPALKTAYGFALYLTQNGKSAEILMEEAVLRALTQFSETEPPTHFRRGFLQILANLFQERAEESRPAVALTDWEAMADAYLARVDALVLETNSATALNEERLAHAFGTLPTEYRAVCALYFLDEWRYEEIAEIVGVSVESARMRLHRGRRWVQSLLYSSIQAPQYQSKFISA